MPQKPKGNIKEKIVLAALKCAAKDGWNKTGLADIAKAAKMSLSSLHEQFEDKADILAALERMIDKKVLAAAGEGDASVPVRERLFDIMMERYDALNEYRTGLVSILDSFILDPKQAVISLPHLCRSMTWMLEAAGVETSGIPGALRVSGLTALHLKVLYTWKSDESEDLSKTMAALDRDLSRLEQLGGLHTNSAG